MQIRLESCDESIFGSVHLLAEVAPPDGGGQLLAQQVEDAAHQTAGRDEQDAKGRAQNLRQGARAMFNTYSSTVLSMFDF